MTAQHMMCTDMKKTKADKDDVRAAEANLKAMQAKLVLMVCCKSSRLAICLGLVAVILPT